MAAMPTYTVYGIKIDETYIPITSGEYDPGIEPLITAQADCVDTRGASLGSTKPTIRFNTYEIATALGVCGLGGLTINATCKATLYFAKKVLGASFSASADSISIEVNEGLMVWRGGKGGKGEALTFDYEIYCTFDGTNQPLAGASNVAAPAITAGPNQYAAHSVVVAGTQIPITDLSFDTGITAVHDGPCSTEHPTFAAIQATKPTVDFSTHCLSTAIAKCSINGMEIDDDASLIINIGKKLPGSVFATTATSISITVNEGMLLPRALEASHNEPATLSYQALVTWDGTNAMWVIATSATLPAASTPSEMYTTGPAVFDSHTWAVKQLSIDFGIEGLHDSASGNYRATMATMMDRAARVSIEATDLAQLPIFGQGEADAVLYFRRFEEGGNRILDATETHLSLTCAVAMVHQEAVSGSRGEQTLQAINFIPVKSGVNAIFAIDTTAAIA